MGRPRRVLAVLRLALGSIFMWAFLDKMFALPERRVRSRARPGARELIGRSGGPGVCRGGAR
jgi:hypothetical protein